MNSQASQSLSRIFSLRQRCLAQRSFSIRFYNYSIKVIKYHCLSYPYNPTVPKKSHNRKMVVGMGYGFSDLNSLQYFVMSQNLCACHCGTRITIDQQLLEERQVWRQKYNCLQKQAVNDIGKLKENIYAECAALMQKQFAAKEIETSQIVNEKNVEIKGLTSRVINLEAKLKISQKENEILRNKCRELEEALSDRDGTIQNLRSRSSKGDRDWQARIEEELTALRKRITQQYQGQLQQKEAENQHLKHKVKEFQKKYQIIIPEVQKLKNTLAAKNQQIEQLQGRLEKIKKEGETQLLRTRQEADEVDKVHSKCRGTINKLSEKVESLTQELELAKKVKREVKIEPVYIERPVEVQKIVEKIVEVERIVNKYIEPTTFRDQQLQAQIRKLKEDNSSLLRELHLFQEKHIISIKQYEEMIKQYQENQSKYKKQREELAKRLLDQEREIDTIHAFIEKRKTQSFSRSNQPEKITIHVNKDGKYQKTVQRVASNSGITTQPNLKPPRKR